MADKTERFPSTETLRAMSEEELEAKLEEERHELVLARFKHATARLERTSDLKSIRRLIARMETILTEKRSTMYAITAE